MKVVYHPFSGDSGTSPLKKTMFEFRKFDKKQWEKMDFWMVSVIRATYSRASLVAEIQREKLKAHTNRRIDSLDDGLFE